MILIIKKMKLFALGIDFDPYGLNHRRWRQDPSCDPRSYLSFPLLFFLNYTNIPPQTLNQPTVPHQFGNDGETNGLNLVDLRFLFKLDLDRCGW